MHNTLYDNLERRILLLDGGFGTMVQGYGLGEAEYRGERFRDWSVPLKGCNDLLALTRPEVVREIHEKYLQAGADIIETDSFNANAVSLRDYGLEAYAGEMARAAAAVARAAADAATARNPQKPRFVAGSMGPTNRTASMSADVANPASREITFRELVDAYTAQAQGLLDGGVDILLIETVFDTLNAKAALYAIDLLAERLGREIPVMVSGTLADASGRTLSGQTVEAFYASVSHARLLSVGFNCAYGARQLMPYLERLAAVAEFRISAHPNAGLPNVMGGYDETPEMFARDVSEYMRRGLVNIVGGCCGTTPAHIFELAKIAGNYAPRPVPAPKHVTTLSGLEPLRIVPEANFVNVGERTNVAGSAKFARLIREGNYEEALSVARAQVDAGAQIVDVCMDDGLIDGAEAMRTFLNLMASEPEIARVPAMIDSSKWEVLVAGLQVTQGKAVVNSISLKEGEAEFLRRAQEIHRYGAAAVVMLFDERGQADTYERKTEVASRAYKLLTDAGFPAEDIIFDEWMLCPIYYYVDIYMAQQNLENLSTSPLGFKFFMNASNGTDTLKVCTGPDPDTIDPALNSAVDGGTMIDHAFEGLYTVAYGTTPTPGQAESVEISEDGLTYTFHLREGLKWSDGTPLTAHDFVYSWQRAVDPATGADYAYMFECIAGYTEAINGEEYVAPAADASSASTSESAAESVSASTSESASTSAAA